MTENKYKENTYSIIKLYSIVKDSMNKELKDNGYRPIGSAIFKRTIKHYFKHIFNRVVYKHETVELYNSFGTLTGNKKLCTQFNPKYVDVNKTDGYFYFILWLRPKKYRRWAFKPAPIWKKRQFQNYRDNNVDYPEVNEMTYGFYN